MALTIDELLDEISVHLQDPAYELLNRAQLLEAVNSAAWDASAEGWVLSTQDESLTTGSADYEYDVPAGLAYIHEIWQETTTGTAIYPTFVPWHQWELVIDASGTPAIHFSRDSYSLTATIDLRVKGQTRPTTEYSADTDVIDTGMESFIRERAVVYAARNLSRGSSGHAQQYAQLEQTAMENSMRFIEKQGEFFRPKRYSRAVPGR
ncbi:hypothetical protein LCGC14_1034950 [marine sediment metagenome]|uniref:Uncharacterized protein n=1 Tax=marine sediment metagenome TaxID=412755 RepID=A0A0F9NF45_9ZZZZ